MTKDRALNFILLAAIITLLAFRYCDNKSISNSIDSNTAALEHKNDSLKSVISIFEAQKDSLVVEANKKDTVRRSVIKRYRDTKAKIDSLPCDSALKYIVQECDTIIAVDSAQIVDLKLALAVADTIISDQKQVINNDSAIISNCKKQIKREKRKKRIAIGFGVIGWAIAIFK